MSTKIAINTEQILARGEAATTHNPAYHPISDRLGSVWPSDISYCISTTLLGERS